MLLESPAMPRSPRLPLPTVDSVSALQGDEVRLAYESCPPEIRLVQLALLRLARISRPTLLALEEFSVKWMLLLSPAFTVIPQAVQPVFRTYSTTRVPEVLMRPIRLPPCSTK